MELQHFTPLVEVLCGFNAAFYVWGDLAERLATGSAWYAKSQERARRTSSHAEKLHGSEMVDVVARVQHVELQLNEHTVPQVRRVVEQGRLWAAGFALAHMSILMAAGLWPEWSDWLDFGLPGPPLLVIAAAFTLVSLGPIWVTIARVSRTRLEWEKQCSRAETEVAKAIELENQYRRGGK